MNSIGITRSAATIMRSTTGHIFVIGGHRTVKNNYYYFETSDYCARNKYEPKLVEARKHYKILKLLFRSSPGSLDEEGRSSGRRVEKVYKKKKYFNSWTTISWTYIIIIRHNNNMY